MMLDATPVAEAFRDCEDALRGFAKRFADWPSAHTLFVNETCINGRASSV